MFFLGLFLNWLDLGPDFDQRCGYAICFKAQQYMIVRPDMLQSIKKSIINTYITSLGRY